MIAQQQTLIHNLLETSSEDITCSYADTGTDRATESGAEHQSSRIEMIIEIAESFDRELAGLKGHSQQRNQQSSQLAVHLTLYTENSMQQAGQLCAWPLVLSMFNALAGETEPGTQCRLLAAEAELQMGYIAAAQTQLRSILLAEPQQKQALDQYQFILQWDEFCCDQGLGAHIPCDGEQLHLQLLGHQHIDSFIQIYSEDTAFLCRLPLYTDSEDWHGWLRAQHQDPSEQLFTVMHSSWGMIGVVSLVMHEHRGFFYYWIGDEFRGCSYGPSAVSLLLQTASEYWGLNTCYAKAYEFNQASHSGLLKLGFEELSVRAAAPSDDERFYRWGPEVTEQVLVEEMRWFYQRIGCEKRFLHVIC